MRELALSYGVCAHYIQHGLTSHKFLERSQTRLIEEGHFTEESLITVLAGGFGAHNGASYIGISSARNMIQRN